MKHMATILWVLHPLNHVLNNPRCTGVNQKKTL